MGFETRISITFLVLVVTMLYLISPGRYSANEDEELLDEGARVLIFANVVRPFNSTCEQYPYFDYPFCPPGELRTDRGRSFNDLLSGDCYTNTQYYLTFKKNTTRKVLCEKSLTKYEVEKFRDAVKRKFVYHLAYQKGLLKEDVGRIEDEDQNPKYYLATGVRFYIRYYGNQVINVAIRRDPNSYVDITGVSKMKVSFTYSVKWEETMPSRPIPFPLKENYMPGKCSRSWKANWVSTVFIWISVLSLTLPYLWNYSTRYSKKKKKNSDPELTHGEYCNCPPYTSLLGAVLGNGIQLLITVCIFFVLGYYDLLRTCDLKLLSYDISQVHCYTSVVAGYIATSFHTRFTQVGWKECIFQAATVYIVPALITALLANHLAIATYGILALDRSIILESVFFWGIPSAAFAGLGGLLAMKLKQEYQPLCTATRPVREIHQPHWITFTKILTEIFYGLLVSFFAMYNGMDDIYASLWKLKSCEAFRVLLASFVLVIVVTVLLAIIFTTSHIFYNGDHQWWWRSIFSSASLVIFMFGYGIYFFSRFESDRGSLIRIFGYNACVSYALFLILGAISFYVSYWVHSTYKLLKDE